MLPQIAYEIRCDTKLKHVATSKICIDFRKYTNYFCNSLQKTVYSICATGLCTNHHIFNVNIYHEEYYTEILHLFE